MADLPLPAVPDNQKTGGTFSPVLLIQDLISVRMPSLVPVRQSLDVFSPAPAAYSRLLKSRSSARSQVGERQKMQMGLRQMLTCTVEEDGGVTSHFIPELLHEIVEYLIVALNRAICFIEDVLANSFPCSKIVSPGWQHGRTYSQKVLVSE